MFNFLRSKEESKTRYLHVAIDIKGAKNWSENNKLSIEDGYQKCFSRIKEVMEVQIEQKIPIVSFLILPLGNKTDELLSEFKRLIGSQQFWDYLKEHKIRVNVFGKWYDLPSEIVGSTKCLIEGTKDYDNFFLNFCLNYDGREEIVDAFKLVARKLESGKLSYENINQQTIKDNIYTSYFIPPNLMIKNGRNQMDSFFLWDCVGAKRVFMGKDFPDFSKSDFEKVLES